MHQRSSSWQQARSSDQERGFSQTLIVLDCTGEDKPANLQLNMKEKKETKTITGPNKHLSVIKLDAQICRVFF